jgi:beta-glucanase (GH16 family)
MRFFAGIPAVLLFTAVLSLPFSCSDKTVKSFDEIILKGTPDKYAPGEGWKLYWSDEFEGSSLDTNKWNYDLGGGGWGNNELEGYTSDTNNVYLKDGKLVIQANKEDNIYFPYSSGRINTKGKFSFLYGKIAARIRLPYGLGVWPAFWMMGANKNEVGWPKCGEIDIMEITGGKEYGDSVVYGTVHWYSEENTGTLSSGQTDMNSDPNAPDPAPIPFYKDFHVFELEWTPQSLKFSYDGKEFNSFDIRMSRPDMATFHKNFYVILNLAIGGGLTHIASAMDVTAPFPQTMTVDWVRVYKKQPQ